MTMLVIQLDVFSLLQAIINSSISDEVKYISLWLYLSITNCIKNKSKKEFNFIVAKRERNMIINVINQGKGNTI